VLEFAIAGLLAWLQPVADEEFQEIAQWLFRAFLKLVKFLSGCIALLLTVFFFLQLTLKKKVNELRPPQLTSIVICFLPVAFTLRTGRISPEIEHRRMSEDSNEI